MEVVGDQGREEGEEVRARRSEVEERVFGRVGDRGEGKCWGRGGVGWWEEDGEEDSGWGGLVRGFFSGFGGGEERKGKGPIYGVRSRRLLRRGHRGLWQRGKSSRICLCAAVN